LNQKPQQVDQVSKDMDWDGAIANPLLWNKAMQLFILLRL